ncbi:MAG: hypothetical protein SGPRY_000524, partial [Prymnesium sp.]
GLQDQVDLKRPADFGGTASDEYRALNPQGKIPVLILPSGEALFEAKVIIGYLNDRYATVGPSVGATTAEERAHAAMINQVHDMYIASANSSDPSVSANQGALYKAVDVIDPPSRAAKLRELDKQLDVLESLIKGPYAAGTSLTEADFALFPTLACFMSYLPPALFDWPNPMDDEKRRPKLKAWLEHVGMLPAAQKVKAEIMDVLHFWGGFKLADGVVGRASAIAQY